MNWNDVIFHAGNEELQRFIQLSILAARLGIPLHFHVEGPRGTGKTTLIRAAKTCLPAIKRVKDCLYNCDPVAPHCPDHQQQLELANQWCKMPFLEISHSAKIGTVVGSIDLEKLTSTQSPESAFLPGTLPRAHRGIVFIDEINRLADTSPALVDVLLDAMGTKPGRVQIEETGLKSIEMPLTISVWAASNPDEEPGPLSDIRRQLADRFDFAVQIQRPGDVETVRAIMQASIKQVATYAVTDPVAFDLADVAIDERVDDFLSTLYLKFRLESIRGVQAARLGARLHALLLGKSLADFADLAVVLPAALRHRLESPLLKEVGDALSVAASEQRQKTTATKRQIKEGKNGPNLRYPALWHGLWQRFIQNRSTYGSGQQTNVETTEASYREDDNEKKKLDAPDRQ
ncbi:MAG: ATP-binding protein [Firmicutes bacterium]|nr:ATP-binding protein [Bacillota bacterium]